MSLVQYPEYKDSGIPWLGQVPEHWTVCSVGHRYEVALGKMLDEKRITGKHLAPYLRNADVQWSRINTENLNEMDFPEAERERYQLKHGDLLVCEGGEVGRCAIWAGQLEECYYQKALHRLRSLDSTKDTAAYFQHSLYTAVRMGCFAADESKATIAHLTAEQLRANRFPFPPLAEQRAIAGWLDGKTGEIDAAVAAQRTLLEQLKEKRRALIAHAVTRGLDPAAPLKDSGIAWLGSVPAHWDVCPLSRVTLSKCDGPFGSGLKSEHYTDSGVRVVRLSNIRADGFCDGEPAFVDADYYARELSSGHDVREGDILIAGLGDDNNTVGRSCVAPAGIEPAMVKADCFRYRVDTTRAFAKYLATQLSSTAGPTAGIFANGSTRSRIPCSTMATRPIVLPPLAEQQAIAAHLDAATAKLDDLAAETERTLTLLQEHRTALIAAAVTGKLRVPGVA